MEFEELSPEEINQIKSSQPSQFPSLDKVTDYLNKVRPGKWVRVHVTDRKALRYVKSQITRAANNLGVAIRYQALRDPQPDQIVFEVVNKDLVPKQYTKTTKPREPIKATS